MNKTERTILVSAGIVGLAVILGSVIIADKLSRSLDEKDFWAGSNIPQVAGDVHAMTSGISQGMEGVSALFGTWTRA